MDRALPSGSLPARRILSVWLSRLALDRWAQQHGADSAPLVLISDTAHGPRIDAATRAALEAGARAGMRLADARALCPQLVAMPSDPAGDRDALERLALWAQRWGPWSALDPPDGLLVDVTGAAHLFGGEARLLADVETSLARRGYAARCAIAPTAGAAWALAHYGEARAILNPPRNGEGDHAQHGGGAPSSQKNEVRARHRNVPLHHPAGGPPPPVGEDQLADLPVAALRLEPDVLTVLRRLGLKRLGDLSGIGREALARRFRNRKSPASNPLVRLDQLIGRVPEPLLPVIAPDLPLVQRRLMEPIRHRALLDQVVSDLAGDMVRQLEARGAGARRLELGLWRVDGAVIVRALELAAASRDPAHLVRLFAGKLDDIDAGLGIELARLRASWCEPLAMAQSDIEEAAERHGTSLAALVDRLSVRLGPRSVTRPVLHASHIPERAQRWQAPLVPEPATQEQLRFHARPLKLLDRAEPIAVLYASPDGYPQRFRWRGQVHEVARVEGPERIAPEWWRERGAARLRDYYRVEDGAGRRYWLYRLGLAGDGRGGMPQWFLQGLCC